MHVALAPMTTPPPPSRPRQHATTPPALARVVASASDVNTCEFVIQSSGPCSWYFN
ncbi:hypothetical protein LguiA_005129 [Lonicera macranthoides]